MDCEKPFSSTVTEAVRNFAPLKRERSLFEKALDAAYDASRAAANLISSLDPAPRAPAKSDTVIDRFVQALDKGTSILVSTRNALVNGSLPSIEAALKAEAEGKLSPELEKAANEEFRLFLKREFDIDVPEHAQHDLRDFAVLSEDVTLEKIGKACNTPLTDTKEATSAQER